MTESEWLNATDPRKMLGFLRGKASGRKLRLYACACCHRIGHLFKDDRSRHAVAFAERYANVGLRGRRNRRIIWREAAAALQAAIAASRTCNDSTQYGLSMIDVDATHAAQRIVEGDDWGSVIASSQAAADAAAWARMTSAPTRGEGDYLDSWTACRRAEYEQQAALLRDIIGRLPFRTMDLDPRWLTWQNSTIPKLAQTIYDDRAFNRLPILADAVEEAGCSDADLLGHLRGPVPHVRGCWAVDLILGRE